MIHEFTLHLNSLVMHINKHKLVHIDMSKVE